MQKDTRGLTPNETKGLTPKEAQAVLDFWFGGEPGPSRREWFVKDPAFDEDIRTRFGELHARAVRRELDGWRAQPRPMLALVILLDQFSRNLFRGDARSFAGDAYALELAREAVARGDDQALRPVERQFLYLPFEHSEDLADQDRAIELMRPLDGFPETKDVSEWAVKHRVIIERFGRFPHRNAALGRESTAEERDFLSRPGSGF
jgi:uncharacterized protein (DUF924 family)